MSGAYGRRIRPRRKAIDFDAAVTHSNVMHGFIQSAITSVI